MPSLHKIFRQFCFGVIGLALVLALNAPLRAQSTTTGGIKGTVKDPKELVVPNAPVTLQNTGTGQSRTANTDDTGTFLFAALQPGAYRVTVEVSGFAKFESPNVIVEVGLVTDLEVPLTISGGTQAITVTAEAPLINTTAQDYSANINSTFMSNLPLNGTRWSNVALLTPGLAPDGGFGLLSFRGISGLLNNNTVDGGDNNQAFFSEERGRTRINFTMSPTTIREFQVNNSNFSAEYGRAAGGVTNAVTKSGTNQYHGEVFYHIRDQGANATNPFALVGGKPFKPQDRRHWGAGSIGGPVMKDKLFFFFSYDHLDRNFPSVAATNTPTSLTLSATDQTTVTNAGVTSTQQANELAFLKNLTGTVNRQGNQYIIFPKVDWYITPSEHFAVSYNRLHWDSPAGIQTGIVVNRGTSSFGNDYVRDDSLIAHLYSILGSRSTNELTFQYGRDNEFENTQKPAPGEPLTGPNGTAVDVSITSVLEFGKPTFLDRRALPDEKRYQGTETMAMSFGKHLLKYGADVNRVNDLQDQLNNESGSYSYSNLANFLIDAARIVNGCTVNRNTIGSVKAPCYSRFSQGFGPTAFRFDTTDWSLFVQDQWRVHPRLTLNFGLRYEDEVMPSPQIPNPNVSGTSRFPSDRNNFGPRLGFAWDLTGNGKTALRGGYGIYYGRIINANVIGAITTTGVSAGQLQFTIQPTDATFSAPIYPATLAAAPTAGAARPSVVEFAPGFQNPMIHEADLSLERELGWNTVLSVSWLASLGRNLPAFIDTNLAAPTSSVTYKVNGGALDGQSFIVPLYTQRLNTNFNAIIDMSSAVNSNYNGLAVQVNHRYSHNLQFLLSYTWSHAIDNGQTSTTTVGTTPTDLFPPQLAPDRGNSNFDLRHRFVSTFVWTPEYFQKSSRGAHAILDDWILTPIISIASGFNYSPFAAGNAPGGVSGGINGSSGQGGSNGPSGGSRFPFLSRNSFTVRSTKNVDMRLARRFHIKESMSAEVDVEAFNLFNHVNFTSVGQQQMFSITGTNLNFTPSFGVPTAGGNTLINSRQMQFGAKFTF